MSFYGYKKSLDLFTVLKKSCDFMFGFCDRQIYFHIKSWGRSFVRRILWWKNKGLQPLLCALSCIFAGFQYSIELLYYNLNYVPEAYCPVLYVYLKGRLKKVFLSAFFPFLLLGEGLCLLSGFVESFRFGVLWRAVG